MQELFWLATSGTTPTQQPPIYGQIAGAYYGVEAIPAEWRERLSMADEIRSMADGLYDYAAQSLATRLRDVRAP